MSLGWACSKSKLSMPDQQAVEMCLWSGTLYRTGKPFYRWRILSALPRLHHSQTVYLTGWSFVNHRITPWNKETMSQLSIYLSVPRLSLVTMLRISELTAARHLLKNCKQGIVHTLNEEIQDKHVPVSGLVGNSSMGWLLKNSHLMSISSPGILFSLCVAFLRFSASKGCSFCPMHFMLCISLHCKNAEKRGALGTAQHLKLCVWGSGTLCT